MALTHDDLQAINNLLTPIREEQKRQGEQLGNVEKRLGGVETLAMQNKSILEAVQAGQENQATKADIHDLKVELTEKVKNHERRIENLEEETDTPNPYKH